MPRDLGEVAVRREQGQAPAHAEGGKERVDGADLDAGPPTGAAEGRCLQVIFEAGSHQGDRPDQVEEAIGLLRSTQPAEELLDDQTRGNGFAVAEGSHEARDRGLV